MKTSAQKKQGEIGKSKAFKVSNVDYLNLLEAANEIITVVQDGKIKYANHHITKVTGYTQNELDSTDPFDIIHPDDRERVKKMMTERVKGIDVPESYIFRIFDKDKKIRWLNRNISSIEWEGRKASLVLDNDITALKEVEEDLNHSLQWEKAIFESSRDAIFISDEDSRFIYVNSATSKLTGYTRQQLLRMRIPDIHEHPDLKAYKLFHRKIFEGQEILSEAKILRRDGTKIYTEFNNKSVTIDGMKYIHTTARDVTEHRLAEKIIKESELWLNRIFGSLNEALLVISPDRKVLNVNEATEKMFGYSKRELANQSSSLLHVDYEHYLIFGKLIREAFDKRETARFEFELRRKNGDIFQSEHSVALIEDDAHNEIGIVSVIQDITEKKQAKIALTESEERLRMAATVAGFGIYSYNFETGKAYYSKELLDIYGLKENQAIELDSVLVPKAIYPEDKPHFLSSIQKANKPTGSGILNIKYRIIMSDGEIRWLRVHGHTSFSGTKDSDIAIQAIGIVQDITDREKAEIALIHHGDLLDKLNNYSIKLSNIQKGENLEELICSELKKISGAIASTFSEYDNEAKALIIKHIDLEPGLLKKANKLFGDRITNIRSEVNENTYKMISAEFIGVRESLHELSFGMVPHATGSIIQSLLNIDHFIGMAYNIDGELYGTSTMGIKKGKPDPPNDILKNFIYITAAALKRKVAEEIISKLNERLTLAVRAANIGIWDWDIVNNNLIWDEKMYVIYGRSKEDLTGAYETWLDAIHPEDKEISDKESELARSGEKEYDTEFRILLPDKSVRYIKALGDVIREKSGKPVRMIGVNFDITESKLAEKELKDNQEKLKKKMNELERFNSLTIDRELRMVVIKQEINDLLERLGEKSKYRIVR